MDAFLRLLRYAAPHRAVIAGAGLAMIVYGASSAAMAYLMKPVIDKVLPLEKAAEGLHLIESREVFGKVVEIGRAHV